MKKLVMSNYVMNKESCGEKCNVRSLAMNARTMDRCASEDVASVDKAAHKCSYLCKDQSTCSPCATRAERLHCLGVLPLTLEDLRGPKAQHQRQDPLGIKSIPRHVRLQGRQTIRRGGELDGAIQARGLGQNKGRGDALHAEVPRGGGIQAQEVKCAPLDELCGGLIMREAFNRTPRYLQKRHFHARAISHAKAPCARDVGVQA
eukprot:348886-Pelagomonas_calceolata.AAC.5